jgi:hypothetical protein
MLESLNGVDWDLLHRQKLVLVEWLGGKPSSKSEIEALWGIVHLLDALQDDAEAAGRWRFPESSAKDGGVR